MRKNKPNAARADVDFGNLPRYIGYQVRQAQSAIFRDISRAIGDLGVTPEIGRAHV